MHYPRFKIHQPDRTRGYKMQDARYKMGCILRLVSCILNLVSVSAIEPPVQWEYPTGMDSSYRLITIPPSHYCEKARWALDYLGVTQY